MMLPGGLRLGASASRYRGTEYIFEVAIGFLLVGTYVAFIVFGVLAARLAGDSTVMAAPNPCKVYLMDALPQLMNVIDRFSAEDIQHVLIMLRNAMARAAMLMIAGFSSRSRYLTRPNLRMCVPLRQVCAFIRTKTALMQ